MPQAAMTSSILEALRRLGANMPDVTSGATVPLPEGPGDPGYDPNTLANRVAEPSVVDPMWLQALRAGMNTAGRVGEGVKGMITGGNEIPGPSAENFGAIIAALGPLLGKIVYHGSPHVFAPEPGAPLGRFRMEKIGTGEGAQAYGHGLYFADAPAVAREYQNLGGSNVLVGGKSRTQAKLSSVQRQILDYFESNAIDPATAGVGEVGDAFMRAERRGPGNPKQQWDRFKSEFDKMKPSLSAGPSRGSLYETDLPDTAIDQMLDWDAPVAQQPRHIQNAIAQLGHPIPSLQEIEQAKQRTIQAFEAFDQLSKKIGKFTHGNPESKVLFRLYDDARVYEDELVRRSTMTGKDVYYQLSGRKSDPATGSNILRDAGIPGIKYYDGMSRGAGQGTRNYVVFDDQLPKIVKVER